MNAVTVSICINVAFLKFRCCSIHDCYNVAKNTQDYYVQTHSTFFMMEFTDKNDCV